MITYTNLSKIPFNQSLVEHFISGFGEVFNILRRLGVRIMTDVLTVDKNTFIMSVGGTERRWKKVEELQRVLSLRNQEVEHYFTYCVQCHEFPILDAVQMNLSIDEKAGLAIQQLEEFLQEASIYGSKYARAYMKVSSFIIRNEDKQKLMERFSVSSGERVRQLKTEFFADLRDGRITGVDNIQLSDDFILSIRETSDQLPMYASRTTLSEAYACDYDNCR